LGSSLGSSGCLLPLRCVSFEEKLAEITKRVHTTHFVIELRVDHQVEIVINFLDLCEVLFLHLSSSLALAAVLSRVWEQDLVDYNVVDVDVLLG